MPMCSSSLSTRRRTCWSGSSSLPSGQVLERCGASRQCCMDTAWFTGNDTSAPLDLRPSVKPEDRKMGTVVLLHHGQINDSDGKPVKSGHWDTLTCEEQGVVTTCFQDKEV